MVSYMNIQSECEDSPGRNQEPKHHTRHLNIPLAAKNDDVTEIIQSGTRSYHGIPLLATPGQPYVCNVIIKHANKSNGISYECSVEFTVADEISLIQYLYHKALWKRGSDAVNNILKNTLAYCISHRRNGRYELAAQFCIDHQIEFTRLYDVIRAELEHERAEREMLQRQQARLQRKVKWFTWCYVPFAIIGLFSLTFTVAPHLEYLKGEHNNPSCPDMVYDACWYVISLIVIPLLYGWGAIAIWYMATQIIQSKNAFHALKFKLSHEWEWWAILLGVIGIGALLVFLLWLFSTQFWIWVLVFTPGAVLKIIYGKRRL